MPENENGIAQYVLGVVVIPAAAAALIALPFALRPLRDRRVLAEAGIASALMAAFVLSFARDLGWTAILRQVVAVEGDSLPVERWHRVAMVALVLGLGAWGVALARSGGAQARMLVGLVAALLSAAAVAILVKFPGASLRSQVELGFLVVLSFFGFAAIARSVMLWASWIVFGALAFLMQESGIAYLATMCGAMSAASFLIGALLWIGSRRAARPATHAHGAGDAPASSVAAPDASPRGVAVPIALGTLASVVAVCGRSYDSREIPGFFWYGAVLLPCMAFLGEVFVRPSVTRRRRLLAFGTIFLSAVAFVAIFLAWSGVDAPSKPDAPATPAGDQERLDLYGG
jgi:hypothetical protein